MKTLKDNSQVNQQSLAFSPMNVLVVGDPLMDLWVEATVAGLSAEAPIPVFKQAKDYGHGGGAWNVWKNLVALKVAASVVFADGTPIPHKIRYTTADGRQLFRVDRNDQCWPLQIETLQRTIAECGPFDAVVISDYAKGTLHAGVVNELAKLNLPTFIDSKQCPYTFEGIESRIYFPNLKEFEQYQEAYIAQPWVVLKAGPEGAVVLSGREGKIASAPAVNLSPRSVCGAGDVVLAAMVVGLLATNFDWQTALEFAMAKAGLATQCERTCCLAD